MPDMRFAPPNPLRIADRATGLNSVSVRSYNERLVLSLLLQKDETTRLEIGDRTGLSAQTVSVLVRSLEQEGLVVKGEAQKGRMGPPTVPILLNPDGAFSVGISIGNRQTDIVLIDFVGSVRFHTVMDNPQPETDGNQSEFLAIIRQAMEALPDRAGSRLAGVGLALPNSTILGGDETDYFRALQDEIESQLGISVYIQNDITAAAGAESMFGAAKPLNDYLFFYLGARLHGRLVLNHQIHNGNSPLSFDCGIAALENSIIADGNQIDALWDRSGDWSQFAEHLGTWEEQLIEQMHKSFTSVSQFIEVNSVVLSSYAPRQVCEEICRKFELTTPNVQALAGTITPSPKAVGAAGLSFSSRFMVE